MKHLVYFLENQFFMYLMSDLLTFLYSFRVYHCTLLILRPSLTYGSQYDLYQGSAKATHVKASRYINA